MVFVLDGRLVVEALCNRSTLYQMSHSKTAARASARVEKCSSSTSSRFSEAKNDSAIALSYQSPTVPIDWVIPNSVQASRKASTLY